MGDMLKPHIPEHIKGKTKKMIHIQAQRRERSFHSAVSRWTIG
jgi:hypothetical protein